MAQQINDNFQLLAGLPLDDRTKKSTIADRDAISSSRRFQGLQCFVEQTQTLYQLQGGILNTNWVGIAGSNTSNALESIIDGFYVLLAGKETPLDWETGDKFRGWIANRYVVGTILSLPVSLPSDTLPVSGSTCIFVSVNDGEYSKRTAVNTSRVNSWSQTGDVVTIYTPLSSGRYIVMKYL